MAQIHRLDYEHQAADWGSVIQSEFEADAVVPAHNHPRAAPGHDDTDDGDRRGPADQALRHLD